MTLNTRTPKASINFVSIGLMLTNDNLLASMLNDATIYDA